MEEQVATEKRQAPYVRLSAFSRRAHRRETARHTGRPYRRRLERERGDNFSEAELDPYTAGC
jgi:hypothetical protein